MDSRFVSNDNMAPLSTQFIYRCFAVPTRTQFSPRLENGEYKIQLTQCVTYDKTGTNSKLAMNSGRQVTVISKTQNKTGSENMFYKNILFTDQ